jgi:hypothetical protein
MANKNAMTKLRNELGTVTPKVSRLLNDVEYAAQRWGWASNRVKYLPTHTKYAGDREKLGKKSEKILGKILSGEMSLYEAATLIADYRLIREEAGQQYPRKDKQAAEQC